MGRRPAGTFSREEGRRVTQQNNNYCIAVSKTLSLRRCTVIEKLISISRALCYVIRVVSGQVVQFKSMYCPGGAVAKSEKISYTYIIYLPLTFARNMNANIFHKNQLK